MVNWKLIIHNNTIQNCILYLLTIFQAPSSLGIRQIIKQGTCSSLSFIQCPIDILDVAFESGQKC